MEKNTILKTPLLDIIFEGRNKEYGAYELRSHYNGRLTKALGITFGLGVIVFLSSFLGGFKAAPAGRIEINDTVILEPITPVEPPPVIPPPQQIEQPVATTAYNVPKIVPNEEVKPDEMPPEITDLEKTKIANVTQEGDPFVDVVAPPVTTGGVVEGPKQDEADKVFLKVEIEAEFPGGAGAWKKFVSREIERNIDELQDDGKSGSVVVMFIVDKEGNVSEVKASPCESSGIPNCLGAGTKLAEIAVNAIRKGPKWKPALQNKEHVKAYRRQLVTFQLSED
jgi:protein TonB